MSIFKLPDLGEGLPDAEIVKWHVNEGDTIKIDDPLVSMETAKAVVDVPSPQTGVILKLHGKVGDIIDTGKPLVEFEGEENAPQEDTGTVVGNIESSGKTIEETFTIGASKKSASHSKIKATPAVRALATRLGVDLATLTPSKNGMITAEDVKAAGQHSAAAEIQPLRGVRRTMSTIMTKSHAEVVNVTLVDDADIAAWDEKTDITARIIQALCAACAKEPALNAWFDGQRMERQLFNEVHLGIAMDTDEGLFVPVIKNAADQSPEQLRESINQYKQGVKNREIPPEDLRGNTITLSNFGNFAGRYATPVVVPPTVAILGVGKIYDGVVAKDGQAVIHKMMPLSLTFDHRAVTGGEAARFLAAVIASLKG